MGEPVGTLSPERFLGDPRKRHLPGTRRVLREQIGKHQQDGAAGAICSCNTCHMSIGKLSNAISQGHRIEQSDAQLFDLGARGGADINPKIIQRRRSCRILGAAGLQMNR